MARFGELMNLDYSSLLGMVAKTIVCVRMLLHPCPAGLHARWFRQLCCNEGQLMDLSFTY